ncbi:uncharacterized protein LOC124376601 isoform X2 [Silurus meridionalis]|uniref:uncharacterized protein LOC124376601 isoform X2 n=1 Tax=Silurus meridionalis TaxID=175797 RepID=UPI001EECE7C7|nr:uncharacterized protein LOC124376601 isoform X2 [Silurus meridionalis]
MNVLIGNKGEVLAIKMRGSKRQSPNQDAVFHITTCRDKAGLDVKYIDAFKGRGVFAVTDFTKGSFVLEYRGELISCQESQRRQRLYHNSLKAFMFDFIWHGNFWTIDAARDDGTLGRLVNDDHIKPNCKMKRILVEGKPHLCLFALRDIIPGEEITYNYGDGDCPWRNEVTKCGTESDCIRPASDDASGDDHHCTQHSEPESTSSKQETKCGAESVCIQPASDGASGDDHHCTQHSEPESTSSKQETKCGAESVCIQPASDGASGDDHHCTQHSEPESTSSKQVTKCGTESDCIHPASDDASGDDHHCTQHSEPESTSSKQVTKCGTESDCNYPASDGASGDDHHCTQHSEPESTSSKQGLTLGEMFTGNQYHKLQSQVETSISQLDDVSRGDDRSISSMECSEEEYVPESSDSSSDESDCSLSISKRKVKTVTKICPSLSSSTGHCSVVDVEDTEVKPDQSSSVSVKGVSKATNKTRVYDKKQYCLFCSKPLSKMARHLEQVHSTESEVAKALTFPKGSKERKNLLDHLRNRGNFAHNAEVLQCGKGELVPYKKPRQDSDSIKFVHCCNCQGLFAKKFLWCHMKRCKMSKNYPSNPKPGKNRLLSQSAYMGPVPPGTSAGLWKLFSNMTHDKVVLAIKTDLYIRRLGEYFYNRVGSDVSKHEYIRQKMREIGRLLISAREVTPLCKIEDFVDPANFMHVITAVKKACGYDEEKCTFQRPSLALKLGHSLQKIASLVSFQAMMDGDSERAKKANNFSDMYASRWSELISSHALRTQREVKWNAPLILPFTEDVKMLHLYLDQKQEESFEKLSSDASSKNWTHLAKVTLAQTILFNRRREGEVSKMPLTSFINRNTDNLHEDVALALSELEKKLCHHFTRIEIRGKRGRKVPILLTPAMQKNMELLIKTRESCAIPSESIYMFARPAALSHLRGSDCLREFAMQCGAKNPNALSSTKLRKHIATLSNVLNLNNTELDQLADFLGHDVRVHREYYRLPEGTLQLAKISKILMALETGRLGEFSGKNLDEIDIDPNAVIVPSSEFQKDLSGIENQSDEEDLGEELALKPFTNQSQESSAEQATEPTSTTSFKGAKVFKKKKWDTSEVKAVEKHLYTFIKSCRVPGKKECEDCIKAEPVALKDRDWLAVKFFVKNRITSLKKKI